jgi:hypothetical protein
MSLVQIFSIKSVGFIMSPGIGQRRAHPMRPLSLSDRADWALVGIAGEDDLDAPDLMTPSAATSVLKGWKRGTRTPGNGGNHGHSDRAALRHSSNSAASELSAALSASLSNQLLHEVESLKSDDEAALWAKRRLSAKNCLSAGDAKRLEQAFHERLTALATAIGRFRDSRTWAAKQWAAELQ